MELSIGEMFVVALVIVLLFGPKKIPTIARELGDGIRKMKAAMEDIKMEIFKETDNPISDIKKEIDSVKKSITDTNPITDVQKHIEEMKTEVNLMEQQYKLNDSITSNDLIDEKLTKDLKKSTETEEKKIIPLTDEYLGPVKR